jgi:hypothetical protein
MNSYNLDFKLQFTMPAQGHNLDNATAEAGAVMRDLQHLLFMVRFEKDEKELANVMKDLADLIIYNDIMASEVEV